MAAAAIPIATSVIGGILANKSQGAGESGGINNSLGAQGALANAGTQALSTGTGAAGAATNYYRQLLGTPQQQQAAVAPAARNISDTFAGAEAGTKAGYQTGVARDLTLGGLERGRAAGIGNLVQGVQPAAANALGTIGTTLSGQGIGAFTGAGGLGNQLGLGSGQLNLQKGNALGGFLSQAIKSGLKSYAGRGQANDPYGIFGSGNNG